MKRILIVLSVALLNGCALMDAYLMTKYDPNEYSIISEIRADARHHKKDCNNAVLSKSNAVNMASKTDFFEVYSENVPRNGNTITATKELNKIAQGLVERYNQPTPVSPLFCKLKFETIETNSTRMQQVIGNKPR